jgi:hypothetical protein
VIPVGAHRHRHNLTRYSCRGERSRTAIEPKAKNRPRFCSRDAESTFQLTSCV